MQMLAVFIVLFLRRISMRMKLLFFLFTKKPYSYNFIFVVSYKRQQSIMRTVTNQLLTFLLLYLQKQKS
jgi:hypothetical protein